MGPERTEAGEPALLPITNQPQMEVVPSLCHPERSRAICSSLQQPIPNETPLSPLSSRAKPRDLQFPAATDPKRNATRSFVIPSEAEGSAVLPTLPGNVLPSGSHGPLANQSKKDSAEGEGRPKPTPNPSGFIACVRTGRVTAGPSTSPPCRPGETTTLDLSPPRGPEGRQPKRQPSPEGLGILSTTTSSAVGAALTLNHPLESQAECSPCMVDVRAAKHVPSEPKTWRRRYRVCVRATFLVLYQGPTSVGP
jgi:hypothetical protein